MKEISLNGLWKGRINYGLRGPRNVKDVLNTNDIRCVNFNVPGEIHLDLMKCGMIDDVYINDNVLKARWVEESTFYYIKKIDLPQLDNQKAYITFNLLDYDAEIFVNCTKVGEHHNSFYPCVLDITKAVVKGENSIVVRLSSGLLSVSEKNIKDYMFVTELFDHLLHKRNWLRKPQNEFGWDWSERLVNVGIQGDVKINIVDSVLVNYAQIIAGVSDDLKSGKLEVRLFCEGSGQIELTCIVADKSYVSNLEIKAGVAQYEIKIDNPRLWYPVGYGEPQIYEIALSVKHGQSNIYSKSFITGFRKVVINQQPHSDKGNNFIIEINNTKIFAKGANFVPIDMIVSNFTNERYDHLISEAINANFNMLRIWGGGVYESDYFYDLCNKSGILVWQEFVFACLNYPGEDKEFCDSVQKEARYNVRRLSKNPSLIVWCGNNEIHWLKAQNEGNKTNSSDDRIFKEILPNVIKEDDSLKYYQVSSPMSLDDSVCPNNQLQGDQHPWEVGFEKVDYREYRKYECRFPDEGGLNGSTSLLTAKRCFGDKLPKVHSREFVLHDNYIDLLEVNGNSACNNIIVENLGINPLKVDYEQFVYLSGLAQGEGLKEYIDNFRSRKWDSSAAIFWMFNDCWPCVRSWTIVDHGLNRTPGFYPVKNAFKAINLAYRLEDGKFNLYINNDTLNNIDIKVEYGFCSTDKGLFGQEFVQLQMCSGEKKVISANDANKDSATVFPYAFIWQDNNIIASNRLFVEQVKDIRFVKPNIKREVKDGKTYLISDNFVYGVCLDLDGDKIYKDNFFDLYPNIPHLIENDSNVLFTYNDMIYLKDKK